MTQENTQKSALLSSPLQRKFKSVRRKTALTTIATEDEVRRANGVNELNAVMTAPPL